MARKKKKKSLSTPAIRAKSDVTDSCNWPIGVCLYDRWFNSQCIHLVHVSLLGASCHEWSHVVHVKGSIEGPKNGEL